MQDNKNKSKRKKQILFLVEKYYNDFQFLQLEDLDLIKERILELYLDSDLSIEDINKKLVKEIKKKKIFQDERKDINDIEENTEICTNLDRLVIMLNKEGIDYYVAGSLTGYIKYNIDTDIWHNDIDISLNEKDIDKFNKVCTNLGLSFEDNRLTSTRVLKDGVVTGKHEIIAKSIDGDFHIGAFPFERLANGTVINKTYYQDEEKNPCCRESILYPDLAKIVFGNETVKVNNQYVKIISPEYVYILKSQSKSEKNIKDTKIFESNIDKDKVDKITELRKKDEYIQYVRVYDLPKISTINTKSLENDNTEISQMLTSFSENNDTFNDPFTNKDIDTSNEGGYIDRFTIIILILVVILILLVGLLIINW